MDTLGEMMADTRTSYGCAYDGDYLEAAKKAMDEGIVTAASTYALIAIAEVLQEHFGNDDG